MLSSATSENEDPLRGWGQYLIGEVESIELPGTHLQLLDPPYADHLAAQMQRCIDQIRLSEAA